MKTSEEINEIAKAMALAQAQMKPASEDAINPHFRSKYSNLASIWDAIRHPMTSNGLTVWQDVQTSEIGICVSTRIVHSSGQWVEFGPLTVPLTKRDAHGVGSATTYGKRYSLCAALGVVSGDEDDDGNAAVASAKCKAALQSNTENSKEMTYLNQDQVKQMIESFDILSEDRKKNYMKYIKDTYQSSSFEELPTKEFTRLMGFLKAKVTNGNS